MNHVLLRYGQCKLLRSGSFILRASSEKICSFIDHYYDIWRIIGCQDNLQFIVQQFKQPTWRGESYHVEWKSISFIHGVKEAFNTLPDSI
jgi:hypothetical protein